MTDHGRTCPNCGAIGLDGARFCVVCGAETSDPPQCGATPQQHPLSSPQASPAAPTTSAAQKANTQAVTFESSLKEALELAFEDNGTSVAIDVARAAPEVLGGIGPEQMVEEDWSDSTAVESLPDVPMGSLAVVEEPTGRAEAVSEACDSDDGRQPASSRSERPNEDQLVKHERAIEMVEKDSKYTLIEEGTRFNGTFESTCPVVVRGRVQGEMQAPSLTVSSTGAVHGKVSAGKVQSEGELSGEFDADVVELAGSIKDNTVIRAKSINAKLATQQGKMQIMFAECAGKTDQSSIRPETAKKNGGGYSQRPPARHSDPPPLS